MVSTEIPFGPEDGQVDSPAGQSPDAPTIDGIEKSAKGFKK